MLFKTLGSDQQTVMRWGSAHGKAKAQDTAEWTRVAGTPFKFSMDGKHEGSLKLEVCDLGWDRLVSKAPYKYKQTAVN